MSIPQVHIRAIIFYEWRRGTGATETVRNINNALGEDTTSISTVKRCFARFEGGDTDFEEKPRSGRPLKVEDSLILGAVKEDPEVSTRSLATRLRCSHQTVLSRLQVLGYRKVLTRWIPHVLTDSTRFTRISICQSLLLRPQRKEFLRDLITGDESWVLYDSNTRRALWLPQGEDPPTQAKSDLHPKKCLLCCFWDSRGMLYHELLPQGHTVTGSVYANQLQKLADAVRERRPRRAFVHLLHDNAKPHVAKETREKLEELGWDTVPHPPYSPDIAPSDYHLFRPLKAFLAKKKFTKLEDVGRAVSDFFDSQSPQFWEKGIADLPIRWDIVVANDGDYIVE